MRREPNYRVDLILLVIVGILIGIQVWLGALPTGVFGHDQFTYLDGAWRVACGQTPHVDFHVLYGVLLWKPLQWGLWLSNYDVRGIGFARAFFTAFVVALYLIALRRRPAVLRLALVTFVSVFVATPRPLGEFPTLVSDAMFYNRIGYALVCFVIMDQLYLDRFYRSDTLASGQAFYRGLPAGVAIAALFLIKVSFLLPAGLILLTSALCFRPVVRQVAGVVCGAAATILVALVCLDFRPMAYFADIAMTMRFAGGYIAPRVSQVLVRDWPSLLFVVGAAVLVSMRTARGSRLWIVRYLTATGVILLCDVLGRATNSMGADLPLTAWWCIAGSALWIAEASRPAAAALAVALLVPVTGPLFFGDCAGIVAACYAKRQQAPRPEPEFTSARLRSWHPRAWNGDPRYANENGPAMIAIINDGVEALQALTRDDESVATLALVNPFSFALARRPATGGTPWLPADDQFSEKRGIGLDTIVGDASILLVQRFPASANARVAAVVRTFPDLLGGRYAQIGRTGYWDLYRRR